MKPNALKLALHQRTPQSMFTSAARASAIALGLALLVSACSSVPTSTPLLDQTRMDFRSAQNNPAVITYAPLEMRMASDALVQANLAAQGQASPQSIDALAYLAKQKIALAQEVASQKVAEASIANAGAERNQLRLKRRTAEADEANLRADKANDVAQAAQVETAQAQIATVQAERQTQEAQQRAAQLQMQLSELSAKTTERGIVITIGDVLFATDHASLNPEGMRSAQKLSTLLQENPQRTVMVEGFTDSVGSASYNQGLSERRANSVAKALQDMGVSRARITTHGYGETHPVASNDSAEERKLNRRVEIVLSDDSGKIAQR